MRCGTSKGVKPKPEVVSDAAHEWHARAPLCVDAAREH
jgi:hypothetical protein